VTATAAAAAAAAATAATAVATRRVTTTASHLLSGGQNSREHSRTLQLAVATGHHKPVRHALEDTLPCHTVLLH
jgi:hypothetical protein